MGEMLSTLGPVYVWGDVIAVGQKTFRQVKYFFSVHTGKCYPACRVKFLADVDFVKCKMEKLLKRQKVFPLRRESCVYIAQTFSRGPRPRLSTSEILTPGKLFVLYEHNVNFHIIFTRQDLASKLVEMFSR